MQAVVDPVEDRPLVEAPWRIDEDGTRCVSGQAVDGHLRRDQLQTFADKRYIFFNGSKRLVVGIEIFHLRAFYNVQKMQFHAEQVRLRRDITDGFEHHFPGFTRQPQDQVDDRTQVAFPEILHGPVKHRKIVAAVDGARRFFMDGLQAQLQP